MQSGTDLLHDGESAIYWYGEGNSIGIEGPHTRDANHFACHVQQRSTRVARVDSCIRLNEAG